VDRIEFVSAGARRDGAVLRTVEIRVNGAALVDLLRPVELPYAEAEGNRGLAGSYAPLAFEDFDSDPAHFLGQPVAVWFEEGDTVLMGCDCGVWGCWPLTVRIEMGESQVRWSGFRNGHRDWDLSDLGPFVFGRAGYEAAVRELSA